MEGLSGFITLISYEKSMTGPKFIQSMAQIKSILCPHGFQGAKVAIRCDQATWHTSKTVQEILHLMNIDLILYNSATLSKNIIPELDAKIKIFGQYLAQIVESEGAKILSAYTSTQENSLKMDLVLKINKSDLSPLIASFDRFNYEIKASFHESSHEEDLQSRYDQFLKYLNI